MLFHREPQAWGQLQHQSQTDTSTHLYSLKTEGAEAAPPPGAGGGFLPRLLRLTHGQDPLGPSRLFSTLAPFSGGPAPHLRLPPWQELRLRHHPAGPEPPAQGPRAALPSLTRLRHMFP